MVVQSQAMLGLCTIVATLTIGDVPTMIRLLPRGSCPLCCPVNEERDIVFQLFTPHKQHRTAQLTLGDALMRNRSRFTPHMQHRAEQLTLGNALMLNRSRFDRNLSTVVFVHGYTENIMGASAVAIRDAYLKRGGWNVILVDWGSLCPPLFYMEAVRNTKIVAHYLARFLTFLKDNGTPLSSVHVVGFSLGAHIAGLAGGELKGALGRITGLDPAYPFYKRSKAHRLDDSDAQFVDVIHADSGVFGYPASIGHADFYPNSGRPLQPGCEVLRGVAKHPDNVYAFLACSHQRSWRYYVESVLNERGFLASTCHKWLLDRPQDCHKHDHHQLSYMGFAADRRARGKFYLTTNSESPFAKNLTEVFGDEATAASTLNDPQQDTWGY